MRTLEGFAAMASARGRAEVALRIAGAASTLRNTLGLKRTRAQQLRLENIVATARTDVGGQAERLWLEGERMPLDNALKYALKSAAL